MHRIFIFFSLVFLFSCKRGFEEYNHQAQNFKISNHQISSYQNHQLLSIYNLDSVPKRIVLFSSAHAGMIEALQMREHVIGVSLKKYFYDDYFHQSKIIELGDMEGINIEKLITINPDLVLLNPSMTPDQKLINILKKANIPILITSDFLESTPLAQAEWIRVYGAIFNTQKMADSIYNSAKNNYHTILSKMKTHHPTIMTSFPWHNQWYVSSSRSLLSQFFRDAGGVYSMGNSSETNTPIGLEEIMKITSVADVWINIGDVQNLSQIKNQLPYWSSIKSLKLNQCYNNINRVHIDGANDYWESGVVFPDRILDDIYRITQTKDTTFYYYQKLK